MSIERSHDRPRLQRPRLRDVASPQRALTGHQFARKRPHRSLVRRMLADARRSLAEGTGDEREVAAAALSAWRAGRVELARAGYPEPGASTLVALWSWALQSALAAVIGMAAARAGVGTDRGLQLAGEAQRAAGRAERSWTAAIAACGLLGDRAPALTGAQLIEIEVAELQRQRALAAEPDAEEGTEP